MAGIAEMTRGLIANYSQISEDAQKLFQTERVVIGKCPRCGESVYEGKKELLLRKPKLPVCHVEE